MLLLPERLLIDQFKTVIYIDSIQLWPKMLISHVVGSERLKHCNLSTIPKKSTQNQAP